MYLVTFILTGLDLGMCDKYVDLSNEKLSRGLYTHKNVEF